MLFALSRHSFRYGVPIRFSLEPSGGAERPTIDGAQTRADGRINIPLGGVFKTFEFRGGLSRYHHDELTPEGEVDSSFFTNGGEVRADLVQSGCGGWEGTSGLQYLDMRVHLSGEEKYLPPASNRQLGVFTLQSVTSGDVRFEAGVRIESARLSADADPQIAGNGGLTGSAPLSRSFTPVSSSAGANYQFVAGWRAGVSLSHTERAPAIDELFANGPHGGSETFEEGDPGLAKETSNAIEVSLHHTTGPIHVEGSLYYSRFGNFIFQAPTGEFQGELPVYFYRQGKADYYGFELQSDARFGGSEVWSGPVSSSRMP